MLKLKYNSNDDTIDMYRGKDIIMVLNSQDFGALIREVTRIMREASPTIAIKQERKAERIALIKQLKLLVTINLIKFLRGIKSYWKIINQ